MTTKRTRRHNTHLAFYLRRLRLSLNQAARLLSSPSQMQSRTATQ